MSNYLARQAIYNKNNAVIGYELLYRDSEINSYPQSVDVDFATYDLINSSILTAPLGETTDNKIAFINFTENCILGKLYEKLQTEDIKSLVIIELLETIEFNDNLIQHVKKMKEMGLTLALDDFIYNKSFNKIFKYIDIIKLDITQKQTFSFKEIKDAAIKENSDVKFLAEKIENQKELTFFKNLNFDYYQGYFLGKPEIIQISK